MVICLTLPKVQILPIPAPGRMPEETVQGVFFHQNEMHLTSVLPAYRFHSRKRNNIVVALYLLNRLSINPTTSAGLGIRWRRAHGRLFGCTALTSLETSISTPRVLTQRAWTLAVIAQSILPSLWLPRPTTILPSSSCGHLRKRPVTVSTGPLLGF